jgi:hypothetical protein
MQPATYTLQGSNVCLDGTVTLNLSGSQAGWTYLLYKDGTAIGDTQAGTGGALVFTDAASVTGTFNYAVRTVDPTGSQCEEQVSNEQSITVNPLPAATVTARTICSGQTSALSATLGGGTSTPMTYTWKVGAAEATTTATNSYTTGALTATSSYTVQLTNSNGCSATSNVGTITVNTPPAAPTGLSSNVPAICDGVSTAATLTASGGSAGSGAVYEWGTGSTVGSSPLSPSTTTAATRSVSPGAVTAYWVRLKGTGACSATTTGGVTVSIGTYTPISAGAITAASAATLPGTNPDVTIANSAAASGGSSSYTYQWRRTGTSSATLTGSTSTYALSSDAANYSTAGTYRFNRYAKDATCNTSWVASSNSYTLTVVPPPSFYSTSTWSYGGLMWSDRVVGGPSNCALAAALSTSGAPAQYKVNGDRYYYSWACATCGTSGNTNAQLCPSPWRLPSKDDFSALAGAADASTVTEQWGYGGYAYGSSMDNVESNGIYWSSAEHDSSYAYYLYYTGDGLSTNDYIYKSYGFQVRCVKQD